MKSLLIQLDDATYRSLTQLAPPRKRTQFIRDAVKKAILQAEYSRMREAYRKQPDSAAEADNWSNPEEWRA